MRAETRPTSSRRIEMLDILRGVALLAMAVYHFTWDLEFFGYVARGLAEQGGWRLFARGIASRFLFLVGVGLVLAHGHGIRWRPFVRRFAQVAAGAGIITLATYLATPQGFVFFGILHQIAVASLIGLVALRLPFVATLALGVAVILLPQFIQTDLTNPIWLAWIGLSAQPPMSNDFVPVFPWTGAVLVGIAFAQAANRFGLWSRLASWNERLSRLQPLARLGRHSLLFYLVHQPLLFGLVYLVSMVAPPDQTAAFAESCRATCTESRDGSYCERYCGCVQDDLSKRDLLTKYLTNRLDEAGRTQIGESVMMCSFSAEP